VRTRLAAITLPPLLSAAALTPATAADPVRPEMSVRLTHTATTQTVCGAGQLRGGTATMPTWLMVTAGARSNGNPIADQRRFTGTSFAYCHSIAKQGADRGDFVTVVSYAGAGDDYPSALVGAGLWEPGRDDEVESAQ
jgi:hypothetical protein